MPLFTEALTEDNAALVAAALMQSNAPKTYRAALYLRLSREDKRDGESVSIENQRDMLTTYAEEHGYDVYGIYSDDGVSGTTLNRPDFMRMKRDIEKGKINLVIVKDLSRFARNYLKSGEYRNYFTDNKIRLIAIDDHYDNIDIIKKYEFDLLTPIREMMNELYASDTSKKMRSMRKVAAKQGKFMGSTPSYGYMRSKADKHKLVIDPVTKPIVEMIFEKFKNHDSARSIATMLNNEGIPNPQNYYYHSIGKENPYKRNSNTWCSSTILNILKNEVYTGKIVQSRIAVRSYKTKDRDALPPNMWVIVPDMHDYIISESDFNAVQVILNANKHKTPHVKKSTGDLSLFANIIFCMDCGARMAYSENQKKTFVDSFYRCSRYVQHGMDVCKPHRITLPELSALVLEDIRSNAKLACDDEEGFIRKLHCISMAESMTEIDRINKREKAIKVRISEIASFKPKLIEKNLNGILSDDDLREALQKFNEEKIGIDAELSELLDKRLRLESQTTDIDAEISKLKQYVEIQTLDRETVTSLIESIHVSAPNKVSGQNEYDIAIRYKFQNPYSGTETLSEIVAV